MMLFPYSTVLSIKRLLVQDMVCQICNLNKDKYKCPTCLVPYCSLQCFKSEKHVHPETAPSSAKIETVNKLVNNDIQGSSTLDSNAPKLDSKWEKAFNDPQIRAMLKSDALQIHLATIMKMLSQPQFTNSSNLEEMKEVALLKLNNLRKPTGIEANEIVEEFIQRILQLIPDTTT